MHEVVVDGRFVYLVMPRLGGRTLADRIAAGRPDLRASARMVAQIAAGLDHLHEAGVALRNLRPERIPIDEAGDCSVTPVHLPSRFREPTVGAPWPFYLAPEVVLDADVDHRADIYSLGAILFELLTGRVPFESDELLRPCVMHVQGEPPAPSELSRELDAAVDGVVARALAKNPEERYPSAGDLARALTEAAGVSSSQSCSSNTTVPKHT